MVCVSGLNLLVMYHYVSIINGKTVSKRLSETTTKNDISTPVESYRAPFPLDSAFSHPRVITHGFPQGPAPGMPDYVRTCTPKCIA